MLRRQSVEEIDQRDTGVKAIIIILDLICRRSRPFLVGPTIILYHPKRSRASTFKTNIRFWSYAHQQNLI